MTLPAMRSSSPCATWIAHSVCSGPQTERERVPFPLPLLLQPGAGLPHFTWGLFLLFAVRSLAGFLIEHGHFAIPQTHNGVVRNWQSNGSDVTAAAAAAKRRRLYNIVLLPLSLPPSRGSHIAQGKSHKQVARSSSNGRTRTPFGDPRC